MLFHPDYNLFARLFRWFRRLRHRCGYGIHSPFAFTLVTDVVYNRHAYYAYAPLAQQREHLCGRYSEKDDRLLFRLADHQRACRIAVVGEAMERTAAYLRAARPSASLTQWPAPASLATLLQRHDLIVVGAPLATHLSADDALFSAHAGETEALIVLHGIHHDAAARQLWQRLKASAAVTVTFDLHRFGLAYLRPQLNKQDYTINYF